MDLKELINLCIEVLKDWRVIFITVLMILFIDLAKYVIRYRKKPVVKKTKVAAAPKPAETPKPEEGGEDSGVDE